eukprot:6668557-Prymnesium_polylepis.1
MGCPASARLASCRGQLRFRPRPGDEAGLGRPKNGMPASDSAEASLAEASLGSVPDASLGAEAAAEPGWPRSWSTRGSASPRCRRASGSTTSKTTTSCSGSTRRSRRLSLLARHAREASSLCDSTGHIQP